MSIVATLFRTYNTRKTNPDFYFDFSDDEAPALVRSVQKSKVLVRL